MRNYTIELNLERKMKRVASTSNDDDGWEGRNIDVFDAERWGRRIEV